MGLQVKTRETRADRLKRVRLLLLILWWLALCPSASSQSLRFKNYTIADGIPSLEVYQVRKHSDGSIWFVTDRGVGYIDGNKIVSFDQDEGLDDPVVFAMDESADSSLWFGSISGAVFGYRQGKIVPHPQNDLLRQRLAGSNILSLSHENDTLWLGSNAGILKMAPDGQWEEWIQKNSYDTIIVYQQELRNGDIVFGRTGGRFRNEGPVTLDVRTRQPQKARGPVRLENIQTHHAVVGGNMGLIQLRDRSTVFALAGSITQISPSGRVVTSPRLARYLSASLFEDHRGMIWAGAAKDGVFVLDPNNDLNPVAHYLKGQSVSSITRDNEGGLWFSTLESGIFYAPVDQGNIYFSDYRGQGYKIQQLLVKGDSLWVATANQGLHWIVPGETSSQFSTIHSDQIAREAIRLYQFDDMVLASDNEGAFLFRPGKPMINWNYLVSFPISIRQDSLVSLSNGEIRKTKLHTWVRRKAIPIPGLLNSRTKALDVSDKNDLWVATLKGLFRLRLLEHDHAVLSPPLVEGRISDLYSDETSIYTSTLGQGAQVLSRDGVLHTTITVDDGLPSNNCTAIFSDPDRRLWIGTAKGLSVFQLRDHQVTHLKTFTESDGLPSHNINDIVWFHDHLWVATGKGLFSLPDSVLNLNRALPTVKLVSKELLTQTSSTPVEGSHFEYHQNNLRINFSGIAYRNRNQMRFRYQLHGLDSLSILTGNPYAQFNSLPPGHFRLEVSAQNSDGLWGPPATWAFSIAPPFWTTWWFLGLLGLLMIGVVAAFLRYRYRLAVDRANWQLRVYESEQVALYSQINPHFIYNALNSVQYYLSNHKGLKAADFIARFSMLMRGVLENSKSSYITVAKELEHLDLYLDLERERFDERFQYTIDVDPSIDRSSRIPSMIIQTVVENAVWHGLMHRNDAEGQLQVTVHQQQGLLEWIIRDNGVGRAASRAAQKNRFTEHNSSGTQLIRDRMEVLNQYSKDTFQLTINDLYTSDGTPAGTEVILLISPSYE